MSEYWERELDEPRRKVVHKCDCCGCDICVGDEAYSVDDYNWYCTDCCGLTEVEEPDQFEYEDYLTEKYERNRHDE